MLRQPRRGAVQHRLRQEEAIGRHHRDIGFQFREFRLRLD
jgi:hypothetical protein